MIAREVAQAPSLKVNEPIKMNLEPIKDTTVGTNHGKTLLQTPSSLQTIFNKVDPIPSTTSPAEINDALNTKLDFISLKLAKPLTVPNVAEAKIPASIPTETPKLSEKQSSFQFGNTNADIVLAPIEKSPLSAPSLLNVASDLTASQNSAPPIPIFGQSAHKDNVVKTHITSPIAMVVPAKTPACSKLIPAKNSSTDNESKSPLISAQTQLQPQTSLFGALSTPKSNSTPSMCATSTTPVISTFSFASVASAVPSNITNAPIVSKQGQLQERVTSIATMATG